MRGGFDKDFAGFSNFVSRNQLGKIRINQCEITYINHVIARDGLSLHEDIDRVFNVWKQPGATYPGKAENVSFHARFHISGLDGNFMGRLHVTVQCARSLPDGAPMFVMELTARGQIGEGLDFLDVGREWIVRSFAELTTQAMHKVWGRKG